MKPIVKTWLPVILAVLAVSGVAVAQEPAAGDVEATLAFGTGVDRDTRALIGEAAVFGADVGKVFCLARITGMDEPGEVTFAWYHDGKTIVKVPLQVRSADYRTWSSKNILAAWTGPWEVKLLDAAGRVLASAGFTVE
ncbi:MAG: DUF2914 domain-containing protein [bacterium]